MSNPLEKFFQVQERPDGVYITVNKNVTIPSVEAVLSTLYQASVVNVNESVLREVISRSRGVFERIGPKFEFYDPEVEMFLKADVHLEKAVLVVDPEFPVSSLNIFQLQHFLARKGVRFGIKSDLLNKIIKERLFGVPHVVAEAKLAVAGENARIEMKVELGNELRPEVKSDGSVDFRNVRSFTPVSAGQILALKIPATEGTPGTAVTGENILAQKGEDKKLPAGRNTEISPDGLTLSATKNGIVSIESGLMSVKEVLTIKDDVNFSVGNIKFSGDVIIQGSVLPGFLVETEGSIHINGEVESARIVARNGSVYIGKGVIGRGDAHIYAKTEIRVSFAQEAILKTEGTLIFEKFVMHCDSTCGEVESANGNIIGGVTRAERSISVKHIGSENEAKTVVVLFDKMKEAHKEKLKELNALEGKLSSELANVEKQLKTKAAILRKTGDELTDRHKDEVRKWVQNYNMLNEKIKYLKQKKEEIEQIIAKPATYAGFIQVNGTVFPGVEINLYGIPYIKGFPLNRKTFRLADKNIELQG